MKCEEYRILIEDYVDGALDQRAASRVTAHTETCAECASFYQEMSREQDVYARYQRDVEVTPVLWASIENRIKQERAAQPEGQLGGQLGGMISRLREQLAGVFAAPRLSPAFAAALVIVAIGVTVFVMSRLNSSSPARVAGNSNASVDTPDANKNGGVPVPLPNPPPEKDTVAVAPTIPPPNTVRVAPSARNPGNRQTAGLTPTQLVRDAEQKYLTAIAMLSRDVNRRRSQLDPMMLARFDASLSEIDRTIRETRHVVRENP